MSKIYQLVQSLKPTEKRYIKIQANKYVGNDKNLSLQLFDALDKCKHYQREVFLKKHRKTSFYKNFDAHAEYLFDFILSKLRDYNEENMPDWRIQKSFYKISLLAAKGLDSACEKLIKSVKANAWRYEQYTTLQDILDLQLYLFGNCRIGKLEPTYFEELQAEKQKIMDIINDYNTVLANWHRINLLMLNKAKEPLHLIHQRGLQILSEPAMQKDFPSSYSLTVRNRYLACFELYYTSIGDAEKSYAYNKKLIENREIIDQKMPGFNKDALAVYFNFMLSCFKSKRWQEMEVYLDKTLNYPIKSVEQEIRKTHNYCYNGMLLYLATKQYNKAAQVVQLFLEAKQKYEGRYRLDFLLFTQSLVGFYFFVSGDNKKANMLWREIINGPKYGFELRTQATVRAYQLLLEIQQGDVDVLQYEAQNAYRFVKSANLMEAREQLFFTTLKKYKRQISLKQLGEQLQQVKEPMSETSVINDFIIDWLLQSDF